MTASILPRGAARHRGRPQSGRQRVGGCRLAVTLMLAVTRRLLPADDYVRSGSWSAAKPSSLMSRSRQSGRRVGVYAWARSPQDRQPAAAFETEVGYFSRSRHDVPLAILPAWLRWRVVQRADDSGSRRRDTITVDAAILQKLGKEAFRQHLQRLGDRRAALVTALADKTIAGAGLDVYEQEPHAPTRSRRFRTWC